MESGTKLGPYAILEQLGAGGMGEVWLAEDTRLGRKVAIKVLPAEFAGDPERLARFEQEARAAAALNHPHIAAVHDVGLEDGTHFMVQEYLQGKTLRDLLDAGPVPIEKALALGTEMAEALRAAHRAGIVHRDLKPENVFVTEDGHAKVLDFGLAKLTEVATGGMGSQSMSPTVLGTQAGSVMGTAGYMAPEQVQGEDVDHRADLFAFGCVLYELVTGARAFAGKSVPHTLHKILDEEPEGFEEASDTLPLRLRWLLQRCLAKTAEARAQAAGDVAVELQQIAREVESGTAVSASGQAPDAAASAPSRGRLSLGTAIPAAVVLIALGAALTMWLGGPANETADPGSVRFTIDLPEDQVDFSNSNHRPLAVSPDGKLVALVTDEGLWLRSLNELELVLLRGTEEPRAPSFSPDSSQVAFWADDQIKRIGATGGAPVVVGPSPGRPNGVSWATDGFIYVGARDGSAIHRFAETGGQPEVVVDLTEDDGTGYGPRLLPGGEWLMFTLSAGGEWNTAQIVAQSLVTNERRVLVEGGHDARYSPTGHLLYVTGGVLLARSLDTQTLVVGRGAVPVLEGVRSSGGNVTGAAFYGLADVGTLIYITGNDDSTKSNLGWIDLEGNVDLLPAAPAAFNSNLALAPDGSRYAAEVVDGGDAQIWIYGVDRPSGQRLTTTGRNMLPVWSADGEWVYFASSRTDDNDIWRRRADLSGPEEEVLAADGLQVPSSVSEDGQWLYYINIGGGPPDIWRLPLDGGGEPEPVVATPAAEFSAKIGPGGRYLAFVSNETGRNEAFVLDLETGARWNVSATGAGWPSWSAVRDELYYVSVDGLWLVEFTTDPDFEPAVARLSRPHPPQQRRTALALAPDGERVLARVRGDLATESDAPHIDVVLNWFDELNARAPIER